MLINKMEKLLTKSEYNFTEDYMLPYLLAKYIKNTYEYDFSKLTRDLPYTKFIKYIGISKPTIVKSSKSIFSISIDGKIKTSLNVPTTLLKDIYLVIKILCNGGDWAFNRYIPILAQYEIVMSNRQLKNMHKLSLAPNYWSDLTLETFDTNSIDKINKLVTTDFVFIQNDNYIAKYADYFEVYLPEIDDVCAIPNRYLDFANTVRYSKIFGIIIDDKTAYTSDVVHLDLVNLI